MAFDVGQRQRVAGQRMSVGRNMHGAPVGEDPDQFLARDARPVPDGAGVHVHERRAGGRIETDAAALQPQALGPDRRERHAGDIEIDGIAVDVLAELRDAARARAQHGVGSRRAIPADHLNRLFAADLAIGLPQQIKQMRIHVGFLFLAPVAHEPVELLQRGLVIAAVALEGDGDVFAGMDVVEGEGAGVAFGDGALQGVAGAQQQQSGDAELRTGAGQRRRETARVPCAHRSCCHPRSSPCQSRSPRSNWLRQHQSCSLPGRVTERLTSTPALMARSLPAENG